MCCPNKWLFTSRLVKGARLNSSIENSSCVNIPWYQRRWLETEGKDSLVQMQPARQDAGFFSDDYNTQAGQMVPTYNTAEATTQLKSN